MTTRFEMGVVEDYLRAVAALLARAQREDIIAELRDLVLSRIEEQEAELGRTLTLEESEAVLRETGHPVVVAARYRDGPQYVVGPALYPYWLFGVKIAMTIQALVALIVFIVRGLVTGNLGLALGQALGSAATGSITMIGVATIVAWLVERQVVRIGYFDRWRVRELRALEYVSWDRDDLCERFGMLRARGRRRTGAERHRFTGSEVGGALGEIAAGAFFILWWTGLLPFKLIGHSADLKALGIDPGSLAAVHWDAVRAAVFWPVLAYLLAISLKGFINLARPSDRVTRGALNLVTGAALITFVGWTWTASPLAEAVRIESLSGLALQMKAAFDHSPPFPLAAFITIALMCLALSAVIRIAQGLIDILRSPARVAEATD
jgi:prepilin signal peptidase PulO-like enzyme (type II secretory pathway)